jgi:hypothetical protein
MPSHRACASAAAQKSPSALPIAAGAGTGKTKNLAHRSQRRARPDAIVAPMHVEIVYLIRISGEARDALPAAVELANLVNLAANVLTATTIEMHGRSVSAHAKRRG